MKTHTSNKYTVFITLVCVFIRVFNTDRPYYLVYSWLIWTVWPILMEFCWLMGFILDVTREKLVNMDRMGCLRYYLAMWPNPLRWDPRAR